MSLPGPSRTIVVEPLERPLEAPAPAGPPAAPDSTPPPRPRREPQPVGPAPLERETAPR